MKKLLVFPVTFFYFWLIIKEEKGESMESINSYIGCDVYAGGKVIGRIYDFLIDFKNKNIFGIICLSNTGIIRTKFYVEKTGVLHLDRNGAVIDKSKINYKKKFDEEYSRIYSQSEFRNGSIGNLYIDPETLEFKSVSVKKSFLDDLIYGREFFDINDITLTEKGIVKKD